MKSYKDRNVYYQINKERSLHSGSLNSADAKFLPFTQIHF